MKQPHLRLALPPLAQLRDDTPCAFALVDRHGRLMRAGELPLARIAHELPRHALCAVLAPDDAVLAQVNIPPVAARQRPAAVAAAVEPLALSDLADLCIAHSARDAQGVVTVAWAERRAIVHLWQRLAALGLRVHALFAPAQLASTDDPRDALRPLADTQRFSPLPAWSLAQPALRPANASQAWRGALRWALATAVLWLAGLYAYANQQMREVQRLQDAMQTLVRQTFPQIPVVIAPLKQASDARDALRRTHGMQGGADFLPTALAAARLLEFAAGHVRALHYADGRLRITLGEGYTPPSNEDALLRAASAQALRLEKDAQTAHTWHVWASGDANAAAERATNGPISAQRSR